MRPLPNNCKLFTVPAGMHGTRPWWGASSQMTNGEYEEGWTRRDGWQLYDNGYLIYSSAPLYESIVSETPEGKSYEEVMAIIDAKWPLPAPPLRAGQVWMLEAQQSWTTALLNTTLGGFMRTGERDRGQPGLLSVPGIFPGDTMYGYEAFAQSNGRANAERQAGRSGSTLDMIGLGGGYVLGDQFLPSHDAERFLLQEDPLIKAYLIADPVDPTIVPWTGCKTIGWP